MCDKSLANLQKNNQFNNGYLKNNECSFTFLDFLTRVVHGVCFIFQVDIYGQCTEGNFSKLTDIKNKISVSYLFYLSFENSLCTDYITEKFFRYFEWDVVLVVRGGADYERLLPNDTYIDASKFPSAANLTNFLLQVAESEELYTNYLKAKDKYRVSSYPGNTAAWCNICDKLNNLEENRKSYVDHVAYIHGGMCKDAVDIQEDLRLWFGALVFIIVCSFIQAIRRRNEIFLSLTDS